MAQGRWWWQARAPPHLLRHRDAGLRRVGDRGVERRARREVGRHAHEELGSASQRGHTTRATSGERRGPRPEARPSARERERSGAQRGGARRRYARQRRKKGHSQDSGSVSGWRRRFGLDTTTGWGGGAPCPFCHVWCAACRVTACATRDEPPTNPLEPITLNPQQRKDPSARSAVDRVGGWCAR
jgi:hypothetical protein